MKRRQIFRALFGVTATGATTAHAIQTQQLSSDMVAELMRFKGLEPMPGEAPRVRAFLLSLRARRATDPRVEPAIGFTADAEPRGGRDEREPR